VRAGRISQLRSGLTSSSRGLAELNVTPLIDVVMCLIIFFLLVGRLSHDQANIDLPRADFGRGDESGEGIIISAAVDPTSPGRPPVITIDGVTADPAVALSVTLGLRIKTRFPDAGPGGAGAVVIQLRADKGLPFAAIEPILQACATAGVPGVKLIAERPS